MRHLVIGGWVTIALAMGLSAQEPADPPARVARLNYLDGWVSFRPGNLQEWAPATLNFPLTTGDHLWTDREAHAGLHIGATAIHLAPWTAFNVMRLDDRVAQLSIAEGTVYVRIPRLEEGEVVEIDTPNGAVTVLRPGAYRVDVDPGNDATSVTVRSGEAEAFGNGRATRIREGQMLQLVANAEVASIMDAPPPDPWEEWCAERDRLAERALEISEAYVPAEMEGAEDLGVYGDWSTDASYGDVWTPRKPPAGWAPFRCGHWAFVAPWGWTWIDDAPWGFTTSHYGRWVRGSRGWMWLPGNRVTNPVYSPGMVVFVASGASRVGKITAWIPLAPGERFQPNYRASQEYLRRINLPDVKAGREAPFSSSDYRNRAYAIGVGEEIFTRARAVAPAAVAIGGSGRRVTVDAAPSRESYLGRPTLENVKVAAPPRQVTERAVVVRHELPAGVQPAAPVRRAVEIPRPAPLVTSAPPPLGRPQRQESSSYEASAPPPQRREESRYEAPAPPRHEEPRYEAPARHEEARHEAPAPPARREEVRHEAPAPPQRHEATRHEAPAPPPAAARHEESRPSAPSRSEESRPAAPSAPSRSEESRPSAPPAPSRK